METAGAWDGTASELLKELKRIAEDQGVNTASKKDFPKSANALSRNMHKLKANLADAGIEVKNCTENKGRRIYLRKITEDADSTKETIKKEDGDDNDGTLPQSIDSHGKLL